ncbi:MAG: phosphotransferase [Pseudomonadota bacterium]|nr:phosphotransferase [Pseudomonadota bacterium]
MIDQLIASDNTTSRIEDTLSLPIAKITPMGGDGSERSFQRIHTREKTFVYMLLPANEAKQVHDGTYDWLAVAATLTAAGINCPNVVATVEDGLIIEDGGDYTLNRKLNNKNRNELFAHCFAVAKQMLTIPQYPQQVWCQRRYDSQTYLREFKFFQKMYLERFLKLTPTMHDRLTHDFHAISNYLAQFSKHFVHRDYHSRNIMVCDDDIMLLDFQDAIIGSHFYDPLSLCFDSYTHLAPEVRMGLFMSYCASLQQEYPNLDMHHWKPLLIQRQLKAIGSFARLTIDAKKGNYLRYVQPAIACLPRQQLIDERWSYVSDTLLTQIANSVK